MPATFDPYHTWLGIPPAEQPPNHYRLLGISLFEDSPDVISNAADRQMSHLRSVAGGQRSQLSQQLLNAVSAARICLLDPARKASYDNELKQAMEPSQMAATPSGPPPMPAVAPVQHTPPPAPATDPLVSVARRHRARRRASRSSSNRLTRLLLVALCGLVGSALGYFIVFVVLPQIQQQSAIPTPVPKNAPANSTNGRMSEIARPKRREQSSSESEKQPTSNAASSRAPGSPQDPPQ